jgi:DNA-binding NarL/FixJ family response regulator
MKRVLLIATQSLFGLGVENLLHQEDNLEIIGCESDVDSAMQRVENQELDVVLIELGILETQLGHPLQDLLRSQPNLTVIELNPEDESICIYSSQHKTVKKVRDLVEAIEQSRND